MHLLRLFLTARFALCKGAERERWQLLQFALESRSFVNVGDFTGTLQGSWLLNLVIV